MTTFAIYAARALAVYLAVAYLTILTAIARLSWRIGLRIADCVQRRSAPPAPALDPIDAAAQAAAELDQHLDQYADSIRPLYPTGEQQQ